MPRRLLAPTAMLLAIVLAASLSGPSSAGGAARPVALLAGGCGLSLAAGLLLPRKLATLYGLAVAATLALLVLTAPDGLSGRPLAGPLGYGNANGALCAQGAAAAMIPAVLAGSAVARTTSLLLATLLVALAWVTQSVAGFAGALLCVLLPLLLVLRPFARTRTPCRIVTTAAAMGTVALLMLTSVLAVTYDAGQVRGDALGPLVDGFTERRVALWSEAVEMLAEHPGAGVGFGRFDEASPTASADEDARWAHSEYLELAAETGAFGLAALLGLTAWVFLALWRACARSPLPVVGACAAGAVLGHAAIDYVLHFPLVPLVAMATLGVCLRHETTSADSPS